MNAARTIASATLLLDVIIHESSRYVTLCPRDYYWSRRYTLVMCHKYESDYSRACIAAVCSLDEGKMSKGAKGEKGIKVRVAAE